MPLALGGHMTNELESCWCQKLTEWIKNNYLTTPNLRGNAFKGDILWHFDFQQIY